MRRKNLLVRLFRALSGESQSAFGKSTGVHAVLIARHELDLVEPGAASLERLARGAGLTVADGEKILDLAGVLRRPRQRVGQGASDLEQDLASVIDTVYQRLLRLSARIPP